MKFLSPTQGLCGSVGNVVDEVIKRIESKPEAEWTVAIGTDSQNKGNTTKFCRAILVLERGKGGTYFYSVHSDPRISITQHRMLKETELSINLGHEFIKELDDRFFSETFDFSEYNFNLEIHCDLGHNGKSRDSIQAAIGWITAEFGDSVTTRIKPDSPAASYIADNHTK